ncbi:DNA-binding protein [Hyella patelloides LEGE 07179]|uniref:DNA-binding protein n=1 Tax=Hyella patelloides LEGE 07179 TaxID=945734 RepID=A0A563VJ52_9CYAN|nr:DNA-binding protein [Hyella patelloides]VEP11486.1 DNA-binding protein [Hyella patelloides LEGE 07179]
MKRKVIGIIGSGTNPWREYAEPLAQWIAQQDYHLLTGAGKGVMASASKAFCQVKNRQGVCLGIVPTKPNKTLEFTPKDNYPNPWVEIAIITPLPTFEGNNVERVSRNYICVLSSDLLIALPGNEGTKNEIDLARRFHKLLILFAPESEMPDFPHNLPRTSSFKDVKNFILENLANK